VKSAFYLFSSILGINGVSKVFAGAQGETNKFSQPRIALIIDDIGYSPAIARQFMQLGIPISFSVLPRLPHSYDLAEEIRYKGQEIMLHQPMEPYNSCYDPGPGALYVGYDAGKIARILEENISAVPYAVGINNHMGSKFTSSPTEIRETLCVVKDKGLFFVDSLTSNRSKAYRTAKRLHISSARRNIFLDNVPDESAILLQLYKLRQHALTFGHAVGIGHPFPATARALDMFLTSLTNGYDNEVSFVHASKIL
jgi:uncharacterized protein